jgi:hypothetical protein
MGSAPASGAVFRALAENIERAKKFLNAREYSCAKWLDAGRIQQRPRRACSPTPVIRPDPLSFFPITLSGDVCLRITNPLAPCVNPIPSMRRRVLAPQTANCPDAFWHG